MYFNTVIKAVKVVAHLCMVIAPVFAVMASIRGNHNTAIVSLLTVIVYHVGGYGKDFKQ